MNNPDQLYTVVLITAPDQQTAEDIAEVLVENKIAACVNLLPGVRSIYRWQGDIEREEEVMLMVKTRLDLVAEKLIPLVKEQHPYDVPEILALPVLQGTEEYLDWINQSTRGG